MQRGSVRAWAGEAVCSLALALVGAGMAFLAWRMPLFEDGVPGPGIAPLGLGVALAVLGASIAVAAVARRSSQLLEVIDRDSVMATFLLLVAIIAFDRLGFALSTFLFLLSSFVLIGRERWLPATAVAGSATAVTWALFVKALGVQLPAGVMGGM